jgi:hypothetical protein
VDGVANFFFLIMFCVITALAAQNQRSRKLRVSELAMRTFSTRNKDESSVLQIRDQLPNLAWHTQHFLTFGDSMPVPIPARDQFHQAALGGRVQTLAVCKHRAGDCDLGM